MKPSGQLSLDFFVNNETLRRRALKLAFDTARELDNINQGMLHLGVYRKSPAVKIPYDQLYQLYERATAGQAIEQLLAAVPKLELVMPINSPGRDALLNGMIMLDVWATRPGIDFYADHDDTLELPLPLKTDRYGLTLIDDTFNLESQGIISRSCVLSSLSTSLFFSAFCGYVRYSGKCTEAEGY